jgi:hypothetical protein
VLPFDYPYVEGEAIWPCHDCLPWHVELFTPPDRDELWVREWHAVDCPIHEDADEAEA